MTESPADTLFAQARAVAREGDLNQADALSRDLVTSSIVLNAQKLVELALLQIKVAQSLGQAERALNWGVVASVFTRDPTNLVGRLRPTEIAFAAALSRDEVQGFGEVTGSLLAGLADDTRANWLRAVRNHLEADGGSAHAAGMALTRVSRFFPRDGEYWYVAGRVFAALGLPSVAIASFSNVLEDKVWGGSGYRRIVQLLRTLPDDFADAYRAFLEESGASGRFAQQLSGLALARSGQAEQAIARLAKVEDDDPCAPEILAALCAAYRGVEQYEPLLECARLLLQREDAPADLDWTATADACRAAGDQDLAFRATLFGVARGALKPRLLVAETPANADAVGDALSPPLVLVSQIQRSGGTLLSQLFDGHPDLWAYPHELKNNTDKTIWPIFDLQGDPKDWLDELFPSTIGLFEIFGFEKADGNDAAKRPLPFEFSSSALCDRFLSLCAARRPSSQRDVWRNYFDAFFKAWRGAPPSAKLITAFTPRLSSRYESLQAFFASYPDGRFVSCIRDPRSWFASASRHAEEFENRAYALELWRTSTFAALLAKKTWPEQTYVLTYDALVSRTEDQMRDLAAWMGVDFDPALLVPTVGGVSIGANSSYKIEGPGVHSASLDWSGRLGEAEAQFITRNYLPLYEAAREAANLRS